jgi:inosine-uridine nucleoside N-ribohydrolase
MLFCQTYNLGGDRESALRALGDARLFGAKFVSKNLCHRVFFDVARLQQLIMVLEKADVLSARFRALRLIARAMEKYVERHADGKKFHDPLALACALAEKNEAALFTMASVRLVFVPSRGFGCADVSHDNDSTSATSATSATHLPTPTPLPHRIAVDCDVDKVFSMLFEI